MQGAVINNNYRRMYEDISKRDVLCQKGMYAYEDISTHIRRYIET